MFGKQRAVSLGGLALFRAALIYAANAGLAAGTAWMLLSDLLPGLR